MAVIMRHSSISRRLPCLTLAALTCVAATAGCAPDKGPGSVVVNYVLGNNKACADFGLELMELKLYQGTFEDPTVEYDETKFCNADGELTIADIEPGIYSVSVVGHDAAGVAIFDNLGQPATERTIEVFEAAEATVDAELTARPSQLLVSWRLGVGGFGNCASVGIDRFEVTAYEEMGGTLLLETVLDCDLPGDGQNGYRLIEDPERVLNGTRFGEVGIQPLDAAGSPVGDPTTFAFTPVGAGYPVELSVECTDTGCYELPMP